MSVLRDALRDLSDAVFFDLLESDEAYLLVLDLPGVSAETLDLAVEDGRILIEARREKQLPGEFRYIEENRSMFLDADLPLPDDASERDAEASVDRGVLELSLPKRGGSEELTIDVVEGENKGDAGGENEDETDGDESGGDAEGEESENELDAEGDAEERENEAGPESDERTGEREDEMQHENERTDA